MQGQLKLICNETVWCQKPTKYSVKAPNLGENQIYWFFAKRYIGSCHLQNISFQTKIREKGSQVFSTLVGRLVLDTWFQSPAKCANYFDTFCEFFGFSQRHTHNPKFWDFAWRRNRDFFTPQRKKMISNNKTKPMPKSPTKNV